MEQKSTGWTGTGIAEDVKKSKQSVIYESMNAKEQKLIMLKVRLASNKKSYDGAHDYKQELKSGYRHSERFETDTCPNMKHEDKLLKLAILLDEINEKIHLREQKVEYYAEKYDYDNASKEVRRRILEMGPTDEMYKRRDDLQISINKELNKHDLDWFVKTFCKKVYYGSLS